MKNSIINQMIKIILPILILVVMCIVLICYFFNIWFFCSISVFLIYKLILRFLKKEPKKMDILKYGQFNISKYDK